MKKNTELICPPDISDRNFNLEIEQTMRLSPEQVYAAWTMKFDSWFAKPGTLIMAPEVNGLFFFETEFEGKRHPHYGRFLSLVKNKSIAMTWITEQGTKGAETILIVDIIPANDGVLVKLRHSGFRDEAAQTGHKHAWIEILKQFEGIISRNGRE